MRDPAQQPDLSNMVQVNSAIIQASAPPLQVYPPAPNPFLRTPIPPSQWTTPDSLRQFYQIGHPQNRIGPLPTTALASINSSSAGVSQTVVNNNIQNIINETLAQITPTSDGLLHGDPVWDYDSAYTIEREDFLSIGESTGGEGGALTTSFTSGATWNFVSQTFASDPPYWSSGGVFPNIGMLGFPNNSTANQANFLLRGPFTPHGMPLLDYPGWKLTWIFQVSRVKDFPNGGNPTPAFAWAKVSLYAGLANWATSNTGAAFGNTTTPRPPFFCGLRYDTDTTAPSIGDTQFVFEYVNQAIGATYTRNNTQGTTQATGINAVEGTWYRFEMACTAAGQVALSLTNGTTTFSSTLTVTKITLTTNPTSLSVSNGTVQISYGGNQLPYGLGTIYIASFSAGATLSGTFTQFDVSVNSSVVKILGTGTGGVPTVSSLVFYPAYTPVFVFGNDSQAAPTGWSKGVFIDFYSFVWNKGLAGATSTTATLPRYQ